MIAKALRSDPRIYQVASLLGLLLYGKLFLDFDIGPERIALTLTTALLTQAVGDAHLRRAFEPRSALISGLSLCLLLRTSSPFLVALASIFAVGSKFCFRFRGKHLFNPTNVALTAALLTGHAWISPAQWGSAAFLGFLVVCLGGVVIHRAGRSDVTYAFLFLHVLLLFGRAAWLGDPISIPIHQVRSGALLIFAFFMISDPRTTPDSRAGRLVFALLVVAGAGFVQFDLFRPNGLLYSLTASAFVVPLLDVVFPGKRHSWTPPAEKGDIHAPALPLGFGTRVPGIG